MEADTLPMSRLTVPGPRHWIGGAWCDAADGAPIETIDPATGERLGEVAAGGAADIDRAVAAARAAFEDPAWAAMNPHDRTRCLLRIAGAVDAHAEELALIESRDAGIPISIARAMVRQLVRTFEYFAGWPSRIGGETLPTGADLFTYTAREPLGVCGLITPWNAPLVLAGWKMAPALATGNSVVIKPSELTSLSTLRLGQIIEGTDLPAGVVNIVTGIGADAGQRLIEHPHVRKISFTGSTATGKRVLAASVDTLKKVTLELGGKSPNIIFPDCDLDVAAAYAVGAFTACSGQICTAGTRILVHRDIHDVFAEKVTALVAAARIGDPMDPAVTMGPLVSQAQFDRVMGYLTLAREEGAQLRTGGARHGERGFFVQPTLFTGAGNDTRIAREEIFGPVATLLPFRDEEEAVTIANDTPYGLAAALWTRDMARGHRLARRIEAGTVWINSYLDGDIAVPFGGYKQSGLGRENGREVIDGYTQSKAVYVRL